MLALTFANPADYDLIRQDDTIDILNFNDFSPKKPLEIRLNHADGTSDTILANHTYNKAQIDWVRAGSALNKIREELEMHKFF